MSEYNELVEKNFSLEAERATVIRMLRNGYSARDILLFLENHINPSKARQVDSSGTGVDGKALA
jgi:hypothetical protein